MARKIVLWALAVFFIVAGANHFLTPAPYLAMMPPYLPHSRWLIAISGVAETMGGIGLLFPQFRRAAGWGLIALLIAIFPANIQVALHGWPGVSIAGWVLWARLPFQLVFIGAVAWVSLPCHRR